MISDKGTPLMLVVNENGGLKLCTDYKVTVNKYLEGRSHSIPRVKKLFSALQGGKNLVN